MERIVDSKSCFEICFDRQNCIKISFLSVVNYLKHYLSLSIKVSKESALESYKVFGADDSVNTKD